VGAFNKNLFNFSLFTVGIHTIPIFFKYTSTEYQTQYPTLIQKIFPRCVCASKRRRALPRSDESLLPPRRFLFLSEYRKFKVGSEPSGAFIFSYLRCIHFLLSNLFIPLIIIFIHFLSLLSITTLYGAKHYKNIFIYFPLEYLVIKWEMRIEIFILINR